VRDLQNQPANVLTPRELAAAAKGLAKKGRITCRIVDEKEMKQLGMGLLLGVAAGSRQPPRLVHLVYKPKGRSRGKVALVGKGLTFDSGGISIKPSAKMDDMRFDMSGAGAVLGVFHALGSSTCRGRCTGSRPARRTCPAAPRRSPATSTRR
jgi:leucyl aminopeptidase